MRIPIAEGALKGQLADRGIPSDLHFISLDFTGAEIAAIRLGAEESPDLAISGAILRWDWRAFSPRLTSVRLVEPRLRVRIDPAGQLSLGSIDHIFGGGGAGGRPALPGIRLDVDDGQALIEAPFGAVTASFRAAGVLGRDFSALAQVAPTTRENGAYALTNGAASLGIASQDNALVATLRARADGANWNGARLANAAINLEASAPLDLARAHVRGGWGLGGLRMGRDIQADSLSGAIQFDGAMKDTALAPSQWTGQTQLNAVRLAAARDTLLNARLTADLSGADDQGRGEWTLAVARVQGFGLSSQGAGARGALSFDLRNDAQAELHGDATLTRAALGPDAQEKLRTILPELGGSPVGPTFAQAERALDAAADRFDLSLPIAFSATARTARLVVDGPMDVRAANGTRINIAPIRADAPALALQWPGPSLAGGVALDMSGGGAPNVTLLLDQMDWSTGAPFEAEGTLDIHDWRSGAASIAADDLIVRFSMAPDGGGQMDLVGPARITGPVGDGEVRDMIPDLDLAIAWGNGWRVTPNHGCLPVRLGGLDAAGLSFAGGAFALCPAASGSLVAADANARLSGGFSIHDLHLDGALSGPNPPPARLRAANVVGRFTGTSNEAQVLITASAPALAVDFGEGRTLTMQGQELTANASVGHGTWGVVGAFTAGELNDPTLPGAVSAIAGRWSAAPDADTVVVRVEAGEAFVQARTAPEGAADPRPLFNPIRLTAVEGTMRDGEVHANGAVVLDADGHALANFTAEHDLESGVGGAHVAADDLVFDESFQPYQISEFARGLVENVRGPASASADAVWTREDFRVSGAVRPNGVSLAMATIPVIQDVRGEIAFDDLLTMTTPPGQQLTIGMINPGIELHNGRVAFQLLPEQRVSIERAAFDFAGGQLAVAPTVLTLGSEETRFNLTLSNVDMTALITQLNMPDLEATGRVEGTFPVRLTDRSAFIENGALYAAPGGGTIAYVGSAGDNVTGMARVAFDALKSFRYDDLRLTLNGDLNGEVISQINFVGENTGGSLDMSPIANTPLGAINARGVPFAFRVQLTAPFRQLARTAAGIINPSDILNSAQGENSGVEGENPPASTSPSVDVQVDPLN